MWYGANQFQLDFTETAEHLTKLINCIALAGIIFYRLDRRFNLNSYSPSFVKAIWWQTLLMYCTKHFAGARMYCSLDARPYRTGKINPLKAEIRISAAASGVCSAKPAGIGLGTRKRFTSRSGTARKECARGVERARLYPNFPGLIVPKTPLGEIQNGAMKNTSNI